MKTFFTIILICTFSLKLFAQDVIIKKDKTEIKSKVLEIGDDAIKYKKIDMLDGPTYSMRKTEVFMIIYANGKKEYIESSTASTPADNIGRPTHAPLIMQPSEAENTDSWTPARLIAFFNSTTTPDGLGGNVTSTAITAEFTAELKIIPGFFNVGLGPVVSIASATAPNYTVAKNGTYTVSGSVSSSASSYGGVFFGSLYAPINTLMGDTGNAGTGFYPFARVGYEYLTSSDSGSTVTAGGVIYEFGIDYKFSQNFGVAAVTSKFNSFGAGISFGF